MPQGEIDPRYRSYYQKAHEARAKAFRDAFSWLIGLGHAALLRPVRGKRIA